MAKAKKKTKKSNSKKKAKTAKKSAGKKQSDRQKKGKPAKKKAKKVARKAQAKKTAKKKPIKKKAAKKKKPVNKTKKKKAPAVKSKPAKKVKKAAPAKAVKKAANKPAKKLPKPKKGAASQSEAKTKEVPPRPKQVSQPATPQPKPKLVTPKKPETPVLKIVLCGPHSVYWIPNDTKIQPDLLEQGIHKDEQEQAQAFKAPKRRDEFLRARWLYHRVAKVKDPLLREESGLPNWPSEVIGSISHKDGHVMFAKVDTTTHYGLGIDVEKLSKVRREFEEKICNADESMIVDRVEALSRMSREEVLALIFSFKESVYKTHYPMGKVHFGFLDAEITEIAYERREIMARMKKQTSSRSPVDHQILGFYNFVDYGGERYIVSVAEERKPLVLDPDIKPKGKVATATTEVEEEIDEEIAAPTLTESDDEAVSP